MCHDSELYYQQILWLSVSKYDCLNLITAAQMEKKKQSNISFCNKEYILHIFWQDTVITLDYVSL
jgi:hypothetical protein